MDGPGAATTTDIVPRCGRYLLSTCPGGQCSLCWSGQRSLWPLQVGPSSVQLAVGAPPATCASSLPWSTRMVLVLSCSLLLVFFIGIHLWHVILILTRCFLISGKIIINDA